MLGRAGIAVCCSSHGRVPAGARPRPSRPLPIQGQLLAVQLEHRPGRDQPRRHRGLHARHDDALPGAGPAPARAASPGDLVDATLVVEPTAMRGSHASRLPGPREALPAEAAAARHRMEPHPGPGRAGARPPSHRPGRAAAALASLAGRRLASLTFVYTRCPLPDVLPDPRSTLRQAIQRAIAERTRRSRAVQAAVRVASIRRSTRRPVLRGPRRAARRRIRASGAFATAPRQTVDVRRRFGVNVVREPGRPEDFVHNLRRRSSARTAASAASTRAPSGPRRGSGERAPRGRAADAGAAAAPWVRTPPPPTRLHRRRAAASSPPPHALPPCSAWLNALPYNTERGGETLRSFRGVVAHGTAHCLEAALFAAVVLEQHGYPPLVLSFESMDCSTT